MKQFLLGLSLLLTACSNQPLKNGLGHSAEPPPKAAPEISSRTHVTETPAADNSIRIQELSRKGNFFRINRGSAAGVAMGDEFEVVDAGHKVTWVARVVALRPASAFLRVKENKSNLSMLQVGLEVRRVPAPAQH